MVISKRFLIQVNNQNGNWISQVKIPYSKNNQIKKLNASLKDAFGREIRKLSNKDIVDRSSISSISLYEDDFIKEFELVHNSYPYLIEYSYTQEFHEFITIDKWLPNYRNMNTLHAKLTLETPLGFDIKLKENNVDPAKKELLTNDVIKYVWEKTEVAKIIEEYKSPSWRELSPSVTILPEKFHYGINGSTVSWKDYGNWIYNLGLESNNLDLTHKELLKSITYGVKDKREIIRTMYNYLQDEMRYINVSIDLGGLKPYPASYVAKNKYGDCKALTYYMKSALESFDIKSYAIDIYWSSNPIEIQKELPSQQFNHVFLCVPLEEDTIWLENTSRTQPFNYIDSDKQGATGLLINEHNSQLITLPKMKYQDVRILNKIYFELKENDLLGNLSSDFTGSKFETLNYISSHWNETDQDSWVKRNFQFNSSEVLEWKILNKGRNESSIAFSAMFTQSNHVKNYGTNKVISIPISALPELEKPEERKYELRFRVPKFSIDTIQYQINSNDYTQIKFPENTSITNEYGTYDLSYIITAADITCIRTLRIKSGTFTLEKDYKGFYSFIEKIKKIEAQSSITLKP